MLGFAAVAMVLSGEPARAIPMVIFAVLYPVLAFIFTAIAAAIYNFAATFTGGLRFTLQQAEGGITEAMDRGF